MLDSALFDHYIQTMTKFIAYYRVSTQKQGANGLGMDAQRAMLSGYSAHIVAEYVEVESGKNNARPALAKALNHAKALGATLVIAKIDRLARNMAFIANLMDSEVDFIAADMPTANRLMLHIMAAFAEHEGRTISERTKAGLAQAKARGTQLGGYRGPIANAENGLAASLKRRCGQAEQFRQQMQAVIKDSFDVASSTLAEIAAGLNSAGYKTPRGAQWSPMQVKRVLTA